jgi:chromosome segregation ATPase
MSLTSFSFFQTSQQLKIELNSVKGEVSQAQNTLKQKEKDEQQLQGTINQLKQSAEQKKKQIEALQGEVKNAVSQKVLIITVCSYRKKYVGIQIILK